LRYFWKKAYDPFFVRRGQEAGPGGHDGRVKFRIGPVARR